MGVNDMPPEGDPEGRSENHLEEGDWLYESELPYRQGSSGDESSRKRVDLTPRGGDDGNKMPQEPIEMDVWNPAVDFTRDDYVRLDQVKTDLNNRVETKLDNLNQQFQIHDRDPAIISEIKDAVHKEELEATITNNKFLGLPNEPYIRNAITYFDRERFRDRKDNLN